MLLKHHPQHGAHTDPIDLAMAKVQAELGSPAGTTPGDLEVVGREVLKRTVQFLRENNIVEKHDNNLCKLQFVSGVTCESFSVKGGDTKWRMLLDACHIPQADQASVANQIVINMNKYLGGGSARDGLSRHLRSETPGANSVSLSAYYSPGVMDSLVSVQTEAFGQNINDLYPEVAAAIAVPLIRYHQGTADKLMPRIPAARPTVHYLVPRHEVFSLADAVVAPINMTELYWDPERITNRLKRVVPKFDNRVGTEVVEDGVLAFSQMANLRFLALDPSGPTSHINHTDTIADAVRLEKLIVTLTAAEVGSAGDPDYAEELEETFELYAPKTSNEFRRIAGDSMERSLSLVNYPFRLVTTTPTSAGVASEILAAASAGEAIEVVAFFSGQINLETGDIIATCPATLRLRPAPGAAASPELTAMLARLTVNLDGYVVDARHSEENMRQSQTVVREQRRHFEFNIPTGRNVLYDTALTDNRGDDNSSAMIASVLRLGDDSTALRSAVEAIEGAADGLRAVEGGSTTYSALANTYVAGNRVRPTVIIDAFDPSDLTRMRDADRQGDVRQRFDFFLTGITTQLLSQSLLAWQLPEGVKPTFRCMCGPKVLGRLFGSQHIHAHLNQNAAMSIENGAGNIQYRCVLQDGTVLEVVTNTFKEFESTLLMVAHIPDAPESDVNFGHIHDHGIYFLSYTPSADAHGQWKRLAGNSRIMPIPTNPVGALIDIINLDSVTAWSTASAE